MYRVKRKRVVGGIVILILRVIVVVAAVYMIGIVGQSELDSYNLVVREKNWYLVRAITALVIAFVAFVIQSRLYSRLTQVNVRIPILYQNVLDRITVLGRASSSSTKDYMEFIYGMLMKNLIEEINYRIFKCSSTPYTKLLRKGGVSMKDILQDVSIEELKEAIAEKEEQQKEGTLSEEQVLNEGE